MLRQIVVAPVAAKIAAPSREPVSAAQNAGKAMRAPPFPLPPWTDRWDPRPEKVSQAAPIPGACNLPLEELASRMGELPRKGSKVLIVATGELATSAFRALEACGRVPILSPDFESAGEPGAAGKGGWRLWRPNAFLSDVLRQLGETSASAAPRALDLACGSGREALLMASWGFEVTAVDILDDALAIARALQRRYSHPKAPSVRWRRFDLEAETPDLGGGFELVASFRYLNRALLARESSLLAPGGNLVCETFTQVHRAHFGKPKSDAHVLAEGELPALAAGLEIVRYEDGWHEGAHTARLWARLV